MNSEKMRAYVLLSAVAYLRNLVGEKETSRLVATLPIATRQSIEANNGTGMIPTDQISDVYKLIVALSKGDDEHAKQTLIECGKYTANEASNTFLRLIMRMMPPKLFAKKLPDFWLRDCTAGKIVAEVHEDRLTNTFSGMGGFDHIAPVAVGYVVSALTAMGKDISKTDLRGWSLSAPGPDTFSLDVHWAD